jgi:hypothetical protein
MTKMDPIFIILLQIIIISWEPQMTNFKLILPPYVWDYAEYCDGKGVRIMNNGF